MSCDFDSKSGVTKSIRLTVVVVVVHGLHGVGRCRRPYKASTHWDLHARPKPPSATEGRLKLLAHKALSIATLIIASCVPAC